MTSASRLASMADTIGCPIRVEAAEGILRYLDAMLDENERINLTAVREREEAVLLHALDSLAVASSHLALQPTACLDLGSGNGFPGVVVSSVFPESNVVLMDRTLKKLKAIERALEAAELASDRIRTVQMDAAAAPAHGHARSYDLVTARAVGDARTLGHLARPLLRDGGRFLIWMSQEQRLESPFPRGYGPPRDFEYKIPAPLERRRTLTAFKR